jgi:hypothetical protein
MRDCFRSSLASPDILVEESDDHLSVGLIALLDDITAIAKMAAASLGDAAAQAANTSACIKMLPSETAASVIAMISLR